MTLAILPLYWWALFVFLLPGFAVNFWLSRKEQLRETYAMILLFASGGTLGYLAFWIYFANKSAGITFSLAVAGLSAWYAVLSFKRNEECRRLCRSLALPLIYLGVVGACYLSLLFAVADPFANGQDLMDWRFFTPVRPGDNIIPWLFASKIYRHEPLIPFCCGDWLSSDRPPLQAGIFLLFWPLKRIGSAGLSYQLLASGLQCSWICAVWVVLKTLNASKRRIAQTLGLLIPSAFFFYNTIYTWPKLLAATFILFTIGIVVTGLRERRALTQAELILASVCVGLAIMAHPGSVFSLPLIFIVVAAKRVFPWRAVLFAGLVLLSFAVPWTLYQKFFDPPGDRLLKMHLAGIVPVDPRPPWQAIKETYASLPLNQILLYKLSNIARLVGPEPVSGFGLKAIHLAGGVHVNQTELEAARVAQREYIWSAIGILNLGWLAIPCVLARRRDSEILSWLWLLVAGAANLILWCFILFGPGATVTEHSSYADLLLVIIGLSGFLLALPRWIPLTVVGLELGNVLVVWLPFRPRSPNFQTVTQWPLVIFAALSFAALLVYTLRQFAAERNPMKFSD